VEAAIEREVSREGLKPEHIAAMREQLEVTSANIHAQDREVKAALRAELHKLELQEERLIELAADGSVATPKLKQKLAEVAIKKGAIAEKVAHTVAALEVGARHAQSQIRLLERPTL
jgi:hypothetical protein